VRPVFATMAGIAVATAALAGVFIGTIGTFDPQAGPNTLAGGVALGVTQVVVGEVNQAYAVLAVHLLFLAVLTVRPGRAWSSWPAWRWCPSSSASAPTLFIWSPRTG
jgi:branched-subunit amino acid ABC-type transport system permease component